MVIGCQQQLRQMSRSISLLRGFCKFRPLLTDWQSKRIACSSYISCNNGWIENRVPFKSSLRHVSRQTGLKAQNAESNDQNKVNESQVSFDEELARLSVYQRYKKLFKEYWYVLVPVHIVTSVIWFGTCYLIVQR